MYRLFIDEVGHDNLCSANDPNERYLCLMGVCLDLDYANGEFTDSLNELKTTVFGSEQVILHRREIIDKRDYPFTLLCNEQVRGHFDERLLHWFEESKYTAFAVLIDKRAHVEKYRVWRYHPYHYCLTAMLERYVMWLKSLGQGGIGDVMSEWRGKKPNRKLEEAYARLFRSGTDHVPAEEFQKRLTSNSLKIKRKSANVAGLQLADLLANPVCRSLICANEHVKMTAPFGTRVINILIRNKFRRGGFFSKIQGYGVKILP